MVEDILAMAGDIPTTVCLNQITILALVCRTCVKDVKIKLIKKLKKSVPQSTTPIENKNCNETETPVVKSLRKPKVMLEQESQIPSKKENTETKVNIGSKKYKATLTKWCVKPEQKGIERAPLRSGQELFTNNLICLSYKYVRILRDTCSRPRTRERIDDARRHARHCQGVAHESGEGNWKNNADVGLRAGTHDDESASVRQYSRSCVSRYSSERAMSEFPMIAIGREELLLDIDDSRRDGEDAAERSHGFHLVRSKWDPYPWIGLVEKSSSADVAGLR
ncbi:unnamed protein product [Trichogramma brassicae]|uniref:Uncharacterized protein n=1 Tax=Trichogramma brassicae TaxID=86971 RepID=A0A6H5HZ41_9HYME|nr:unnamed protein product [Trichogramma brassicae]